MSMPAMPRMKNHDVVMAVLEQAEKPMSAYEILAAVRTQGLSAPPTVYRALNRLIAEGRVHRVESLNAYLPCRQPDHGTGAVFLVCDGCGAVEEIADPALERMLRSLARGKGFTPAHSLIEMHGTCAHCAPPGPVSGNVPSKRKF